MTKFNEKIPFSMKLFDITFFSLSFDFFQNFFFMPELKFSVDFISEIKSEVKNHIKPSEPAWNVLQFHQNKFYFSCFGKGEYQVSILILDSITTKPEVYQDQDVDSFSIIVIDFIAISIFARKMAKNDAFWAFFPFWCMRHHHHYHQSIAFFKPVLTIYNISNKIII